MKIGLKASFALLVAFVAIIVMSIMPMPFSQQLAKCCDQFSLQAFYGFPFAFRTVYTGGFTGAGQTVFSTLSLLLDFVIIFGVVLAVAVMVAPTAEASSSASTKKPAHRKK